MNRKNILWLYAYMIVGILDLSFIAQDLSEYRYFSKPLIILFLIIYFIKGSILIKGSLLRKTVLSALVFSLLGDILWLFPHLFLYGLGAFLMVHFCYILSFKISQSRPFHLSQLYFIKLFVYNLPFYILAAVFYYLVHNQLQQMKIPVVIFLFSMVLMCTVARERFRKTNHSSFWQVFVGATLLFLSHSILLLDLFFQPGRKAEVMILGTYLLAQLLIVMGMRSHFLHVIHEELTPNRSTKN